VPPLPKLKLDALRELEKELRFAPRDALLRDMERAEELAGQIELNQRYPEDWLVFRVTGFRPAIESPRLLGGAAIATELSAFVERLSDAARLTPSEVDSAGLDAAALCARWAMSRQTLSRLRRRGLVARRVFGGKGRVRLVFSRGTVEAFEAAHRGEVGRAAAYSRIEPSLESRMVARAARYQRVIGCTLNQAAARIAARYGRSHETVRQVLRRHDQQAGPKAVFKQTAPLNSHTREVVYRAWRRGVDPADMARKFRRSPSAVRRAIVMARASRLATLIEQGALAGPVGPDFHAPEAPGAILGPQPIRTGLGGSVPQELLGFIHAARAKRPPLGVEERSRLVAYHFLRFESSRLVTALSRLHPSAVAIDKAETMLRWASRLKVELVRSQLRLMLETVESRLGRPAEQWPAGAAPVLLLEAIHRLGEAVDTFDPFRGARLASAAGLVVDRLAAKWAKDLDHILGAEVRRATVILPAGIVIADWTHDVSRWSRFVEPDLRVREAVNRGTLHPDHTAFLSARFGWGGVGGVGAAGGGGDGGPPRTLADMAEALRVSSVKAAILERRALGEAREQWLGKNV